VIDRTGEAWQNSAGAVMIILGSKANPLDKQMTSHACLIVYDSCEESVVSEWNLHPWDTGRSMTRLW
jgi:hypothetical protein